VPAARSWGETGRGVISWRGGSRLRAAIGACAETEEAKLATFGGQCGALHGRLRPQASPHG
jgi:hypothetical protein